MALQSYLIVGGGIVGLATGLKLQERHPGARVTVLEKESEVGQHQSGHNSGVLHAGLYYKPGSLKARLAVCGLREMVRFCQQHGVAHEICGKLVVAANEEQVPRLRDLESRGQQNGLQGLSWLGPEQMREIEPNVGGVAALRVPQEGIVDYPQVCRTMRMLIEQRGGQVRTNARVDRLRSVDDGWVAVTPAGEFRGSFLFNCAGLHCDKVAQLAGERPDLRIVPFRGEYYLLKPERQHLVRHLIYPTPDPQFPFLGVHFTRLIHGGVECGPNAVLALAREGYTWSTVNPSELLDTLSYGGFWKFFRKYPSMSWYEARRSLSRRLFCESLQQLVPAIREEDIAPGGAGVRAQALAADGTLVQDFHYVARPNAFHLLNAPSPGATASLALADYMVGELARA